MGPGHIVDYVVCLGPIAVPNLSGLAETAATTALTGAGLVPGVKTTAYHATWLPRLVIGSTPAAGALVGPGHVVDYVLSLGPIAVPNLSGLAETAATTALTGAGLVPGVKTTAYHATIAKDLVIGRPRPRAPSWDRATSSTTSSPWGPSRSRTSPAWPRPPPRPP